MKHDNKVMACVDLSRFADCVADHAAWAALRLNAPLEFLHVIDRSQATWIGDDRSGAIGINAQENLLETLSEQDASASKMAREHGRIFLNRLRERAMAAGVRAPDMRQRHGGLVETLEAQQDDVRLFVLGRRGASAELTQRDLGRNVEQVVRALGKPILTVTDEFREPRQVMIAFDGSAVTREGVKMVASSPLFRGIPCHLVMAGEPGGDASRQLGWAKATLEAAGFEAPTETIAGDPEQVIAQAILEREIDMLIMGAYTHSPLRSLFFGSRTSDLLRAATIPTLLLR